MSPIVKTPLAASVITMLSATSCRAHMLMASPPPYGSPDNSPLNADGSNFPCKATSNTGATITNMAIHSPQTLSFKGEAVHGGGSCQVSLTTDNPATKNSRWMVIHSIEGGCPAKNTPGNSGEDAGAPDPNTYTYSIPQGITPGDYTLAWTWFNKVGNREMYINCASIKVTDGSNKRDTYLNETDHAIPDLSGRDTPSFPNMFIANIPATDCTTTEAKDVQFPDAGASVERDGVASDLAPPTGPKCGASGGSSSSSSDSSSGSSGAPATPSVAPPAGAAPPPSAAAAPPPPPAPASPAAVPADASSSSSGSSGSACSSPGELVCSPDGTQFAVCAAGGIAATFQPMAAGTSCKNGTIAAAKSKRSAKFVKEYLA